MLSYASPSWQGEHSCHFCTSLMVDSVKLMFEGILLPEGRQENTLLYPYCKRMNIIKANAAKVMINNPWNFFTLPENAEVATI